MEGSPLANACYIFRLVGRYYSAAAQRQNMLFTIRLAVGLKLYHDYKL